MKQQETLYVVYHVSYMLYEISPLYYTHVLHRPKKYSLGGGWGYLTRCSYSC